jgi:hypothetical protein
VLPWVWPRAVRMARTYVVVSNGGMAGGGTVVSLDALFMSDTFTAMPDFLSDIFFWCASIFMSDTISDAAGPSRSSLLLSDTMSGCAAVLSAIGEGMSSFMSDTIYGRVPDVREDPRWACYRTRACQTQVLGRTTRHIAALRVALHTSLLAPVLQVMADERTSGVDLSGDVPGLGGRLGRLDVLQDRPPAPLERVSVCGSKSRTEETRHIRRLPPPCAPPASGRYTRVTPRKYPF